MNDKEKMEKTRRFCSSADTF